MTSPKKRRRARRRAEDLMDQAFEALENDNPTLARKLSFRAVDAGSMNPRLWLDHGRIYHHLQDDEEAEAAFRHAIALAPDYADAFAALARLQATRGKFVQAERLQRRVVELQPEASTRQILASYAAIVPQRTGDFAADEMEPPKYSVRTDRFEWEGVARELTDRGMVRLPALISAAECGELIELWDDPDCFERSVEFDDAANGRLEYRFLTRPLPPPVGELRTEVYARLATIANEWQARFGRSERFPVTLPDFLARCEDAGQYRTTPILLRYPDTGFNAPHRDIAGKVVFPFQLAVTLGPGSSVGGDGGELRLVDDRPGRRIHEKRLGSAPGDGIVFCTRDRPVEIAGALGLQPVQHGVTEVTRERYALGIPFHEHG
jgi:uncharacterized protein